MNNKIIVVLAAIMSLVGGLTGCSEDPKYGMPIDAVEVGGKGTLGISVTDQPVKGLIVYFHGSDQNANVIKEDRRHTDFFDPLLRAGYAVVAADAGGNAFGNSASRDDYRRLIAAARQKYIAEPVIFVAESMGALAALALMSDDAGAGVNGMVGISPLMGLPAEVRSVSFVAGPWGGKVPDSADPLTWPPELFAGHSFRLYASKTDEIIPTDASAQAFANRFGSVADIEVIDCAGGHVAITCFQPAEVQEWINNLR